MRITYLLEDTAISGPARTVLAQADALIARGHRVRIATKGAPVTWRASRAEWLYVDDFGAIEDEPSDQGAQAHHGGPRRVRGRCGGEHHPEQSSDPDEALSGAGVRKLASAYIARWRT